MITGAQCVMISSQMWMPLLYADNWDLNHRVQVYIHIICIGRDIYVKNFIKRLKDVAMAVSRVLYMQQERIPTSRSYWVTPVLIVACHHPCLTCIDLLLLVCLLFGTLISFSILISFYNNIIGLQTTTSPTSQPSNNTLFLSLVRYCHSLDTVW